MNDILTKDERETVEKHRESHDIRFRNFKSHATVADAMCADLLAIIDNLSKRGVKKYSEEELRASFEKLHPMNLEIKANGIYRNHNTKRVWAGWKYCARFLGALEEK